MINLRLLVININRLFFRGRAVSNLGLPPDFSWVDPALLPLCAFFKRISIGDLSSISRSSGGRVYSSSSLLLCFCWLVGAVACSRFSFLDILLNIGPKGLS